MRGRIGATILGLIFAVFGAGIVWLPVSALLKDGIGYVPSLVAAGVGGFICLFGVSTAWQSVRGQPSSRGFFMRWLMKASTYTSPAHVLFAVVALGVFSLLLGFALDRAAEIRIGLGLLLAWVAFHLQILFHEYGHWFVARGCGYQPFRVVAGAFGFTLHGSRWVAYANREWCFLTGGAVFAHAPSYAQSWARDVWVVAAGPLATGLLLFVFVEVGPYVSGVPLLHDFIQTNITLGTLTLVLNLVPLPIGASALGTDGYQLLQLFRRR